VCVGPRDRAVRVVDSRRERVLGCEAVVDRQDEPAHACGELPADVVGRIERSEDPAAAVAEHHRRPIRYRCIRFIATRWRPLRSVRPEREVVVSGPLDGDIAYRSHRGPLAGREQFVLQSARARDRQCRPRRNGGQLADGRDTVRVQVVHTRCGGVGDKPPVTVPFRAPRVPERFAGNSPSRPGAGSCALVVRARDGRNRPVWISAMPTLDWGLRLLHPASGDSRVFPTEPRRCRETSTDGGLRLYCDDTRPGPMVPSSDDSKYLSYRGSSRRILHVYIQYGGIET
jgi:hypothetical protein